MSILFTLAITLSPLLHFFLPFYKQLFAFLLFDWWLAFLSTFLSTFLEGRGGGYPKTNKSEQGVGGGVKIRQI